MIVYYLGRADGGNNLTSFPPGFKMLSGLTYARSYNTTAKTWDGSSNIADRVSFVCINPNAPDGVQYDSPNLQYTDCPNGLRAQIQFQSCWDGINLYKSDNSHVDYLSGVANGNCPPTHPVKFISLFLEVYYFPNQIAKEAGGRFVFANGDTTGYGFHGDFINGWNTTVLDTALEQCATGPNASGLISDCAPLAVVDSSTYAQNCPERPPLVDEQVYGVLENLPGCNEVTSGPQPATLAQTSCPANVSAPTLNTFVESTLADVPVMPTPGLTIDGWKYQGFTNDPGESGGARALPAALFNDNTMTVEECHQSCDSRDFLFAGLSNGKECWCDNGLHGGVVLNGSDVNGLNFLVCDGNDKEFCGGGGVLMVYQKVGSSQIANSTGVVRYAAPRRRRAMRRRL
jgi:hypothetical protein